MSFVTFSTLTAQVGMVKIEDKDSQNSLSLKLIHELRNVFKSIEENPTLKVVILAGYDKYFLNGANKETLLDLIRNGFDPNHLPIFSLPLECKIPTIAAMEGSALAGGLCFGLFADIIIMGEESKYCSSFMQLGITPGDGSTCIIPYKLGTLLGQEMLLTANSYKGKELKNRGAAPLIVKNEDVLKVAIKMAKGLAVSPLTSLRLLKENMTEDLRKTLPKFYEKENHLQEMTFRQPEVQEMINTYMK